MASTTTTMPLRALVRVTRGRVNAPRAALAHSCANAASDGTNGGGSKKPEPEFASASPSEGATSAAAAAEKPPSKDAPGMLSKPIKNLRDMMEAMDIMVEEAEKKVEKKYRPNMIGEFKQLNDTEGKVHVGAEELIPVDKARKVLSLQATSLDGKTVDVAQLMAKQDATLIVSSFKNFGLEMLPAWRDPFLKEFARQKNVRVVTLNIIEDWYMKLVQGSIVSGLKGATPAALHGSTFAHFGRCDDFRTALDLYNSYVGYVNLVDNKGRVRWIAGGPATPEELKRLYKVTSELLAQQKQNGQRRR